MADVLLVGDLRKAKGKRWSCNLRFDIMITQRCSKESIFVKFVLPRQDKHCSLPRFSRGTVDGRCRWFEDSTETKQKNTSRVWFLCCARRTELQRIVLMKHRYAI